MTVKFDSVLGRIRENDFEGTLENATTDNTLSVDQNGNVGTDVATDGAVHIENTGNTGIGLGVYTNIGATADAPLVFLQADNTAFDQNVLKIFNDGTASAIFIENRTAIAGNNAAIKVYSDTTQGGAYLIDFAENAAAANLGVVNIVQKGTSGVGLNCNQDGPGYAINVDHDDSGAGASVNIDRDGNNVAYIFGLKITVDNAGVGGLVCGIDFSDMADTEPLLKLTSTDTDLSTKSPETDAEAGWFPVLVGTTKYAVPIYALS